MLTNFELYTPTSVAEACQLKKEVKGTFLAGGTDVLVAMHGGKKYDVLIDLKGIEELRGIRETEDALVIGALTPHHAIEESHYYQEHYSALWEGCSQVGSVQIRYRGTIGGNLCNAVPSADSIGPLLVFGASCVIASADGERTVPLSEFFVGPKKTVLGEGELLKAIVVPKPAPKTGSCYIKYTRRRAMDLALCGCSVLITLDEQDAITAARVSMTTSAPTPVRSAAAEAYLAGKKAGDVDLEELGKLTAGDASPRTSWRSSAEFRIELIKELVGRAFATALARAKEN